MRNRMRGLVPTTSHRTTRDHMHVHVHVHVMCMYIHMQCRPPAIGPPETICKCMYIRMQTCVDATVAGAVQLPGRRWSGGWGKSDSPADRTCAWAGDSAYLVVAHTLD